MATVGLYIKEYCVFVTEQFENDADNDRGSFQVNGQRIIGPPSDYSLYEPPFGSEVFVGNLPRGLDESTLLSIMEKVGRVYEIRLMVDFSGSNRGYGFAKYYNPEDAIRAIEQLNYHRVGFRNYMFVQRSVDNRRLYVDGVPRHRTESQVMYDLSHFVFGLRQIALVMSDDGMTVNRGYAILEFENHRMASVARRKLADPRVHLWNPHIEVDWAEPELFLTNADPNLCLCFTNLRRETSERQLLGLISRIYFRGKIEKMRKTFNFAFVHFSNRRSAEICLEILNNRVIDGSKIKVDWAQPMDNLNSYRMVPQGKLPLPSEALQMMPISPPQNSPNGEVAINAQSLEGTDFLNPDAYWPLMMYFHNLCVQREWGVPQYQFFQIDNGGYGHICCQIALYAAGISGLIFQEVGPSILHAQIYTVIKTLIYCGEHNFLSYAGYIRTV